MDLSSNFSFDPVAVAVAVVALGIVVAVVAIAVIADFVVTNRRERLARHESVRTYYHRVATTH